MEGFLWCARNNHENHDSDKRVEKGANVGAVNREGESESNEIIYLQST
jgi:hypothetical protein